MDDLSDRVLVASLLAFVALLSFGFAFNNACLLIGLDGATWVDTLNVQSENRAAFTQAGVDPLAGSFDAYHPTFREYLLPTALGLLLGEPSVGRTATYTAYAAFVLFCGYVVGRATGFARSQSLLGGALIAVLAFPAFIGQVSPLWPLFAVNPHVSQVAGLSLLTVAAFWALEGRSPLAMIAIGSVPAICAALAFLGLAASAILMAPAVLFYGGASLLSARTWRDDLPRIYAGLAAIATMGALGIVHYCYGLFSYTAHHFFGEHFLQERDTLIYVSTFFWIEPAGRWLILLGVVGAAWSALADGRRQRIFALTHLAATIVYFCVALSVVFLLKDYAGPSPVYFETCLWPYAALFAAIAITRLAKALLSVARHTLAGVPPWLPRRSSELVLTVFAVSFLVANVRQVARAHTTQCPPSFLITKPSAITDHLQQNVALSAGRPFRGLVATITGIQDKPSVDWFDLHQYDGNLWNKIGNEHRIVGLWNYRIPTLFQYFSFITPPYYLLLTKFLARPMDRQTRSTLVLTQINEAMMRLWGVRYVITDVDHTRGREVATVSVPGQASLRLMEFADANLGQYSPTQVLRADDFRSGLAAMQTPGFDGRSKLVTEATLEGRFTPATDVQLIYERDGFRLRARSPARSLLVLPIQYSHCWTIHPQGATSLFRANLMQLGVAFSGRLDAKLVFAYGPIWAGGCRIEDFRDMQRLHIDDAG